MKAGKAGKNRRAAPKKRRSTARAARSTRSATQNAGMLRHSVATLAYRAGKAVRGAPAEFAGFQAASGVRTPLQILAHMGDLLDWALSHARGKAAWRNAAPLEWDAEAARFFAALKAFDDYLASGEKLQAPEERLLQGPVADALQHTGQLTILRRVSGAPIRGENYFKADISKGRVGAEQAAPKWEFD